VLLVVFGVLGAAAGAGSSWAQGDSQPPGIVSSSPAPAATGVSIAASVTATFNEPVQPASIGFVLRDDANTVVPASLSYTATTRTVALAPQTSLPHARTYTATVAAAVDLAGNPLSAPVVWSFTTHPGFQEAVVFGGLLSRRPSSSVLVEDWYQRYPGQDRTDAANEWENCRSSSRRSSASS
jgi:hypothetical protein